MDSELPLDHRTSADDASLSLAANAGSAPRADRRFHPRYGVVAAINQSLLVFPVLVTVWLFVEYHSAHQLAVDFHHDFWVAGFRVLHGLSPYHWTRRQIAQLVSFPYPATAALFFVPFSLLPRGLSDLIFMTLSLTACLASLRILNVRDWRLYTLLLLWWPVINAWQTANVTLLFVCGVASVWRYRDSPLVAGVITGLMLSIKPVAWPLVLWLLATRRFRGATYGLALALLLNVVSWAVIGVGQLSPWWHLLGTQMDVLYREGYGVTALIVRTGAGRGAGTAIQLVATAGLATRCLWFALRRREEAAFALAVALMLVSSPLVDNHYFALLIVPLAIARPSLGWAWLLPLVLWLCPATGIAGWQLVLAWATLSATLWFIRDDEQAAEARIKGPDTVPSALLPPKIVG